MMIMKQKIFSKSQSSVELVVMVCLLSFVFSIFIINIIHQNTNLKNQKLNQHARYISDLVSSELNNVYVQGEGYSKNFSLPQKIEGYNYYIIIKDNMVHVIIPNKNAYLRKTIPKNVFGMFNKGLNCISNKNGEIYVNNG